MRGRTTFDRIAVVLGLFALAGCARGSVVPSPSPTDAFDVTTYFLAHGVELTTARDELGMSDDTYAVYEDVAHRGYVLVSDIQEVMPELIACVEDVGYEVEYDPLADGFFGLPNVNWAYLTPPGHTPSAGEEDLISACNERTVGALITMFYNQPFSPERNDVWIADGRKEASWTCLDKAGYFVGASASFQDYLDVAKRMSDETGDSTCLELVIYGDG